MCVLCSLRVVFQVQLGHQLVADDGQHLFQLLHVLFGEALVHPLDHRAQVGVADVVVVDILLRGPQVILPAVGGGLDLFHIALAHQRADLIRRVGGGDLHHPGKLRNGGLPMAIMPSMQKRFHRGQGRLTGGKALEHVLVEMELELGIDIVECFFQHELHFLLLKFLYHGCIGVVPNLLLRDESLPPSPPEGPLPQGRRGLTGWRCCPGTSGSGR